jgi:hypothetical protein
LQTAITTYRNGDGVAVELIGAIHIADKSYYDVLNKRFTTCEVLLYEMVGEDLQAVDLTPPPPPVSAEKRKRAIDDFLSAHNTQPMTGHANIKELPKRGSFPNFSPGRSAAEESARDRLNWIHPLYDTLKSTLQLESQMEGIDYSKKNFVHADMTARQFASMQDKRGEGFLQMWWRSMQAQIARPESAPNSPGLLKILEILCRPDSPTELKRLVGRMFRPGGKDHVRHGNRAGQRDRGRATTRWRWRCSRRRSPKDTSIWEFSMAPPTFLTWRRA